MLKLLLMLFLKVIYKQPPSGGCVLKLFITQFTVARCTQPPSGGCVLKLCIGFLNMKWMSAATFGWLCVETVAKDDLQALNGGSHLRVAVC